MRYTFTMPTSQPPLISASNSGSGWPWWAWALLLVAAMAFAAASLLVPRPRWFGRVERWAFWRRESVRGRVRGRRSLAYLYAGLFVAVLVVWSLPSLLTRYPRVDAAARHTAITATRTGLVGILAVMGAGVGLAYTARTYRLSREGHLSDRYTQLGSDKIEVRLGGIYALGRLMRDSSTDQPTIVEDLAAYIRQHAPLSHPALAVSAAPAPSASTRLRVAGARRAPRPVQPSNPDADVQAALTVLGRRTAVAAENPIDLIGTHLAGAQLGGANLTGARLIRANLTRAHLREANLTGAHLVGVNLTDADLSEANLTGAWLVQANLTRAHLRGANLADASLSEANLADAQLVQANLTGAGLGGANLAGAQLAGANLTGAWLFRANLAGAWVTRGALTEEQLAGALNVQLIEWGGEPDPRWDQAP